MGPPEVPAERLQALRGAFDATMKDPAYLEEAKSQKMDVDPMTGEEMEKLLKTIYASPPELVQRLKTAIDQYRDRT
jgi:tripartite-type tricarboxylate transporter receptor subunit TctC